MYLFAIFGSHRSHGNGDINSYINCNMNTSEKAEFTASIHCIEIFKIKNTDLQFRSPGHDWQKNEKMRKNTGNCKTLYVSHKRNNPKVCFFMEYLVSQD